MQVRCDISIRKIRYNLSFESSRLMEQGQLLKIWIKPRHRGPMEERDRATLKAGLGLEENAHKGGKRQVTLIEIEEWSEMTKELDVSLDPSQRRANLLVTGIRLRDSGGRILKIGPCRLQVGGETRPCDRMEQVSPGLYESMARDWRGGVYAQVLDDGEITVGDPVGWENQALPHA
jgi:MOSC domain-containing protein YiiM